MVIASVNNDSVPLAAAVQDENGSARAAAETSERALLYVAATRAKKELSVLSYGTRRSVLDLREQEPRLLGAGGLDIHLDTVKSRPSGDRMALVPRGPQDNDVVVPISCCQCHTVTSGQWLHGPSHAARHEFGWACSELAVRVASE